MTGGLTTFAIMLSLALWSSGSLASDDQKSEGDEKVRLQSEFNHCQTTLRHVHALAVGMERLVALSNEVKEQLDDVCGSDSLDERDVDLETEGR